MNFRLVQQVEKISPCDPGKFCSVAVLYESRLFPDYVTNVRESNEVRNIMNLKENLLSNFYTTKLFPEPCYGPGGTFS